MFEIAICDLKPLYRHRTCSCSGLPAHPGTRAGPIGFDADALIRDIQHAITSGRLPRRLRGASGEYTLFIFTGMSLFSTRDVFGEAIRHLPEIAKRANVSEGEVRTTWIGRSFPRSGWCRSTRIGHRPQRTVGP